MNNVFVQVKIVKCQAEITNYPIYGVDVITEMFSQTAVMYESSMPWKLYFALSLSNVVKVWKMYFVDIDQGAQK